MYREGGYMERRGKSGGRPKKLERREKRGGKEKRGRKVRGG